MRKIYRFAAAVFILACLFSNTAEALSLKILYPQQMPIAPTRDFYVLGEIDRAGAPVSFDIRIDIYDAANTIVRSTESVGIDGNGVTSFAAVSMDYPNKGYWFDYQANSRDLLAKNPPPDLIFKPDDPDSFYDQGNKVAVTEKTFSAVIFGGCTTSFDVNPDTLSGDIVAGEYRIVVSAVSGDADIASADAKLTVGVVADKMLTRFSPADHQAKYTAFANKNNYRIYLDYFPGYWPLAKDSDGKYIYYEIVGRWRANDSIEYKGGNVHTILYNVDNNRCATQKVEIGYLAAIGNINSPRIHYYHYDIGEPSVTYAGKTIEGKIVEFAQGDALALTRAEVVEKGIAVEENKYYPASHDKQVFLDIAANGVYIVPGKTLSVFGVTKPIQSDVTKGRVLSNDIDTYNVQNFTSKLHYDLTLNDEIVLSRDVDIALVRHYDGEKWDEYAAVYEFKHDFVIPDEYAGKDLTMTLYAVDKNGVKVSGTGETFKIMAYDKPDGGSGGGCNAGWFALLIFAALPGAAAVMKKRG